MSILKQQQTRNIDFYKVLREEQDLHGAVENATKTNPILEDLVDLNNGVVGFLGSTIRHIVYMQYHIRHLSLSPTTHNKHKTQTLDNPTSPFSL